MPPPTPAPDVVQRIDYDAHGKLRFRPEYALFGDGPGAYPVTFQFLGGFFPKSVRMHVVEGGEAREILYSPDYFTVRDDSPARELPPDTNAFAGFWIQESRLQGDWRKREPWATFLGASYFRAVGELGQVGMSARGLALNVGQQHARGVSGLRRPLDRAGAPARTTRSSCIRCSTARASAAPTGS